MNRRFTVAIAALTVAFFTCESPSAQDTDDSETADRELEVSIVSKAEPLDRDDLRSLAGIASRRLLQDATLDRVTRKMSSGLTSFETRWVERIFNSYRQKARLPDETFNFLVEFMTRFADRSYVAADVLQTLPAEDERRSIALSALADAFTDELSDKYTTYVIAYIERFDRNGPLNRDAVSAVASVAASSRPYMVRARAMKLVKDHETLPAERQAIYASLLRSLSSDDDPTLAHALDYNNVGSSTPHPYEMMVEFSPRPYRPELIEFLVKDFRIHTALALPVFAEFSQHSQFSEAQRQTLVRWATEARGMPSDVDRRTIEMRQSLFRVLWPEPTPEEIGAAIAGVAEQFEFAPRCKAIYDIQRYYAQSKVPGNVADALSAALLDEKYAELRYVGATIVLDSDQDLATKERAMLELVAQGRKEHLLYDLLLDQYDAVALQGLVIAVVRNRTLPTLFRQRAIQRLGMLASPGSELTEETRAVLHEVVLEDTEIGLGTAETALTRWGIEPPLSDRQKERDLIEKKATTAGILTLVFMVASPIIFIAGLVVIPMVVSPERLTLMSRTGALLGWIFYGAILFILWAYALFGSYGIHGSGAPLAKHLSIMAPFHFASLVGLVVVVLCIRKLLRKRGREREHVAAAPQV